jgi:hypothetical protein
MHASVLFPVFLLATSAAAQNSAVLPFKLANAPGSSFTAYPFGTATPLRLQTIYNSEETGLTALAAITSITVRNDENRTQAAKANIDLQVEMSTTAIRNGTQVTTFAPNRGANHQVVFARRMVSVNAINPTLPGGDLITIVLDAPFMYDPAAGSLLIEYDVASQPAGTINHDVPFTNVGIHASLGTGCNGVAASSTGGGNGLALTWTMTGGAANGVALHVLSLNALPGPIPIPGNPACSLLVVPDFLSVVNLTATGTGSFAVTVPTNNDLRGLPVYGQYLPISAALNVDATNGRVTYIGGSHGVARVYSASSNTALTGTSQANVANVIRITY